MEFSLVGVVVIAIVGVANAILLLFRVPYYYFRSYCFFFILISPCRAVTVDGLVVTVVNIRRNGDKVSCVEDAPYAIQTQTNVRGGWSQHCREKEI